MNDSKMNTITNTDRIAIEPVDDIRVLDERGEIINPDLDPGLCDDELMRVYRAMVLTRLLDKRMLAMQRQGRMGTFAPNLGQEALQIGQVYPLSKDDWYAPAYRSFGAQVWRGWPMERLLLLWNGFFKGFPPPEGVNDLPFSIVIGAQVPVATGIAMGMQYQDDPHCVMVNFGDGASSQGAVAEAMNFAAAYQSPCVFILENNGWAISTPTCKQAGVSVLAKRGIGYGLHSVRVDGNDILAMIHASSAACDRARNGDGPTIIEAVTYRMGLHTTADDPRVYRDDEEVKKWEAKDPILRLGLYMKRKRLLDDERMQQINEECQAEVVAAHKRFDELSISDPREVFDFVYEELTPELEEQKQEYLKRLDRQDIK